MIGQHCVAAVGQSYRAGFPENVDKRFAEEASSEAYLGTICKLLEVKPFTAPQETFLTLLNSSQECDRLGLDKSTKYLAKVFLDTLLAAHSGDDVIVYQLWALVSFRLALKFNEQKTLSDRYGVSECLNICEGRFQHEDFTVTQFELLRLLHYKLRFTTPYEYLFMPIPALERLSVGSKRRKVQSLIDLALTIPSHFGLTAEEIFCGCYRLAFKNSITPKEETLLRGHTPNWQRSTKVYDTLREILEETMNGKK